MSLTHNHMLSIILFLSSRESLKEKLTAAFNLADVVITSGGVSMGELVGVA